MPSLARAAAISLFLLGARAAPAQGPTPSEAEAIAAEAYVYGLPLVEVYRGIYLGAVDRGQHFNELRHRPAVFGAGDKGVRRPNADTAYSQLQADLRAEPLVLSVPEVEPGRYYSVQLVDLFTHNAGYVGSRTTGNAPGRYLVAGPGWDGAPPAGIDGVLRSETELAVVLVRIQVRERADADSVTHLQAGFAVEPLSAFLGKPPVAPPRVDFPPYDAKKAQGLGFLGYVGFLLRFCPEHPSERDLRARLASIGVTPERAFDTALSQALASSLARGLASGRAQVAKRIESGVPLVFGSREFLGNDYLARAAAAQAGIFGNSREEALYTLLSTDAAGGMLDGSRSEYTLHFAPDELPPVRGFWSVTLYTQPEAAFYANPLQRNLINSPMLPALARDADGGLTLRIRHADPGSEHRANWLPAPDGPFDLILRLYWPEPAALEGGWSTPPVEGVARRTFDRTLVEYEEAGQATSVLKFDHERRKDGEWHRLNANTTAIYRIKNRRVQLIARDERVPEDDPDAGQIEAFLRGMDPLLDDDVIEVWIGKDDRGFFARDYRFETEGPRATGLSQLSSSEFKRAYDAIDEIE